MDWWNKNALERRGDLLAWLGDVTAISRSVFRDYVMQKGYHSMVDCGCGPCIDQLGFGNTHYPMEYHGIDTCEAFVFDATARNVSVQQGHINGLPFGDNRLELAYARHVLEHLSEPESALREMVRVASREVIVTFFLPPTDGDDEINFSDEDGAGLYHNRWSERRICTCLWAIEKVRRVWWRKINDEVMLHVEVKA